MNKKHVHSTFLVVILLGVLGVAFNIHEVDAPYQIISIMADGSISPSEANITSSDNVTYTFTANMNASIIVQRSNIIINGNGHILNGSSYPIPHGFNLTNTSNVTIQNVNIVGFGYAMWLEHAFETVISGNNATLNEGGIWLVSSSGNTVSGNNISVSVEAIALDASSSQNTISENILAMSNYGAYVRNSSSNLISGNNITTNSHSGVYLTQSTSNTIIKNDITNNHDGMTLLHSSSNNIAKNNLTANNGGIALDSSSNNNSICQNKIENKYIGIDLFGSYNNVYRNNITNNDPGIFIGPSTLNTITANNIVENEYGIYLEQTSNHSIVGNNVADNGYGVYLDYYSSNIKLYHNNFKSNTNHVYAWLGNHNFLDNGVEGNYWSNYTGVDLNHDGIGDSWHEVNENNTDHYPLIGIFHSFNTSIGEFVNVISNSTIGDFQYFESNSTIIMFISNTTANQTFGFSRIRTPYVLMNGTVTVLINGTEPYYWNYTLYEDGNNKWIYFEYEHSTLEVVIVPEFPSLIILLLFITITLAASVACKKRLR